MIEDKVKTDFVEFIEIFTKKRGFPYPEALSNYAKSLNIPFDVFKEVYSSSLEKWKLTKQNTIKTIMGQMDFEAMVSERKNALSSEKFKSFWELGFVKFEESQPQKIPKYAKQPTFEAVMLQIFRLNRHRSLNYRQILRDLNKNEMINEMNIPDWGKEEIIRSVITHLLTKKKIKKVIRYQLCKNEGVDEVLSYNRINKLEGEK